MAKTIEPISSWQNGEEKEARVFVLTSSYDNLSTNATFQYQLNEVPSTAIDSSAIFTLYNTLVNGSLNISGQDYIDWDAATDANEWAYNWAATQLKLVIIGDTTTTTTTEAPVTSTTTFA
jgi:hypothetical protein